MGGNPNDTLNDIAERGYQISSDITNSEWSGDNTGSSVVDRIDRRGSEIAQDIRDQASDRSGDYRW
jgi:hypothetical protein